MSSKYKRESTQDALDQDEDNGSSKRIKLNTTHSNDIQTLKRHNFIKACELVSQKAYYDYAERLQLVYIPICIGRNSCMHSSTNPDFQNIHITEIPLKVEKLVNVEMDASNWCGALEVCILSITPTQYLSDTVLKNIVEIMLNAHDASSSEYSILQVLDRCNLVLSLHFSTHNPCIHENLRKVYNSFLTSPMDRKVKTRTNRIKFNSEKGILNFCLTRLEYEIGAESSDSALLDKTENTPEELRQTIKGLFYQKEQFEIFEMLDRTERIKRLMAVLQSVIELLQFDLAIGQSILNSGVKNRQHKLLMSCVLEQNENNQSITTTCRQILKLFAYFIHLEYPEEHIKTMTLWLNSLMEMFYMKNNRANSDYPHIHRDSTKIVNELYDIISELPPKSIISILERIKPSFIRHQISHHYCNTLLSSDENDTLQIFIDFLKEAKWKSFPKKRSNLIVLKKITEKRVKPNKLLQHLCEICENPPTYSKKHSKEVFPKFLSPSTKSTIDQSVIISALYIALQSYMEAYGVQLIQETLHELNKDLTNERMSENSVFDNSLTASKSYSVSENHIRKYRHIFEMLKTLHSSKQEMKCSPKNIEVLKIFKNIFDGIF